MAKQKKKEAWYQDLGEGLGLSGINTFYGIKELFKDLTPEERATIKDWTEDAGESGWGTAGQVIGEIGQMALPGGAAIKAAKGASKLQKLAKAKKGLEAIGNAGWKGRLATDTISSAGFGAAQLPGEEGYGRGERAFTEGMGALGGGMGGELLSRIGGTAVRGIKQTDAAKKYMKDYGGMVTPGQAAENTAFKWLEDAGSVTPGFAKPFKRLREESQAQWQDITQNAAAINPKHLARNNSKGTEGFKDIVAQKQGTYDLGYEKPSKMSADENINMGNRIARIATEKGKSSDRSILNSLDADIKRLGNRQGDTISDEMREAISQRTLAGEHPADIIKDLEARGYLLEGGSVDGDPEIIDELFKSTISDLKKKGASKKVLDAVYEEHRGYRKTLGRDQQRYLELADKHAPKINTLEKAREWANPTPEATGRQPGFTPEQVLSAGNIAKPGSGAYGETPLQEIAKLGQATVGQKRFGQPMHFMRRLAPSAPGILPEKQLGTIGKNLLGQGKHVQPALQKVADSQVGQAVGTATDIAQAAGARASMAPHAVVSTGVKEEKREDVAATQTATEKDKEKRKRAAKRRAEGWEPI